MRGADATHRPQAQRIGSGTDRACAQSALCDRCDQWDDRFHDPRSTAVAMVTASPPGSPGGHRPRGNRPRIASREPRPRRGRLKPQPTRTFSGKHVRLSHPARQTPHERRYGTRSRARTRKARHGSESAAATMGATPQDPEQPCPRCRGQRFPGTGLPRPSRSGGRIGLDGDLPAGPMSPCNQRAGSDS